MIVEIVKGMISNSTWIDPDSKVLYTFSNDKELCINGTNKLHYSIRKKSNQVVLKLGAKQTFQIEYVNDFHLNVYNDETKFRLIPA